MEKRKRFKYLKIDVETIISFIVAFKEAKSFFVFTYYEGASFPSSSF
jgi:hypothetical protein